MSASARRSSAASGPASLAAARAVAGLAGLLSVGRRGADAARADGLRRTFELVRRGRERRQVAGARGRADLALGRDRGVAEFRQQRVDRHVVVAEPGREHLAVDRRWRLRHLNRIGGVARGIVDRHPALERGAQLVHVHRLCQIRVHAGGETALVLALHRIGGDRDDRRAHG